MRSARRFSRNKLAIIGLGVLVIVHLLAIFAPLLSNYPFDAIDPAHTLAAASAQHLLGTDELGRDVFARLLYGARVSLLVGAISTVVSVSVGILVGGLSGFFGGFMDNALMRITDAMMSIPSFFLLLAVLALFGGSPISVVLVIGLTSWTQVARIVRGEFIRWREELFVEAARSLGASDWRIAFRHVLPQTVPTVIVSATLGVGFAILTESGISFLGLGIQQPTPTWGNMLMNAQQYVWTAPVLAAYPGFMILTTVLAYNMVGDGLRDALDPTLKR
jgi:peptide/nickel transport system permease protein